MAKTKRKVGLDVTPGKAGIGHGVKKVPTKETKKKNGLITKKMVTNSLGKGTQRVALGEMTNRVTVKKEDGRRSKRLEKDETEEEEDRKDNVVDDEDPEMTGLCEYEKIRLINIRERQAMFAELEIGNAKSDFSVAASTPSRVKSLASQRGLASERKVKEILPPRKSARISGGKVAEIERFDPLVYTPEEPDLKVDLPPLAPLTISESLKNSDDSSKITAATSLLSKLSSCSQETKYTNTTAGSGGTLANLRLTEDRVAKVTPGRIFSLALHPGNEKVVVAAGGKYGGVGLWDVEDSASPSHGVHLFQPHGIGKPVNCLTWDLANTNNLISTSYDGTVRLLDCERQEHSLLYGEENFIAEGGWTSFHSQVDENTLLVSQGQQGSVVLVDRRQGWETPAAKYQLFHRVHAKSIAHHPTRPELLLAANNKGGCFIFDRRSAGVSGSKLVEPCTTLLGHAKSLSSCQFSPLGDQVVTLAADDRMRLYNTSSLPASLSAQCQVRHNNHTGRWLTPLRASWHPTRQGVFFTGSMERPRQIEVWSSKGGSLELTRRLGAEEELLGSVCSLVVAHPGEREVVVGGNASGRVYCFM